MTGMMKRLNIIFFGLCFIAALLAEAYCMEVLKGDLFSTLGVGIVVLITGYLFMDTIICAIRRKIEDLRFYADCVLREEDEKWNERYTELVNLQKATYTATKKNTVVLAQQMKEVMSLLEELESNNNKKIHRIAELQRLSMEGQKKALNLELHYNRENTKHLAQVIREEEGKNDLTEHLTRIINLLETNNELLKTKNISPDHSNTKINGMNYDNSKEDLVGEDNIIDSTISEDYPEIPKQSDEDYNASLKESYDGYEGYDEVLEESSKSYHNRPETNGEDYQVSPEINDEDNQVDLDVNYEGYHIRPEENYEEYKESPEENSLDDQLSQEESYKDNQVDPEVINDEYQESTIQNHEDLSRNEPEVKAMAFDEFDGFDTQDKYDTPEKFDENIQSVYDKRESSENDNSLSETPASDKDSWDELINLTGIDKEVQKDSNDIVPESEAVTTVLPDTNSSSTASGIDGFDKPELASFITDITEDEIHEMNTAATFMADKVNTIEQDFIPEEVEEENPTQKQTNAPVISETEVTESEPEAVDNTKEEEPVNITPLYSDPNKALSADEIAALFASFGK